jgi:hypothetical protein
MDLAIGNDKEARLHPNEEVTGQALGNLKRPSVIGRNPVDSFCHVIERL